MLRQKHGEEPLALARRDNLTIRQLYTHHRRRLRRRVLVGTPADIVDDMEDWVEAGAADGFNLCPPVLPLRARRIRRSGAAGTAAPRDVPHRIRGDHAARENLGLVLPRNRYTA